MTIAFHTLSDVELLRFANASPLMQSPLFVELVDRFEVMTEGDRLAELHCQQNPPRKHSKPGELVR